LNTRKKRPKAKLHGIQDEFSDILGAYRFEQLTGLARLRKIWGNVVGPMMSQRTEPVELHQDESGAYTLIIAVNHSTMAQQIIFLRDAIRTACFEQARISRIAKVFTRVQVGAGIQPDHAIVAAKPITLQQKKQLASDLQCIKDRALRCAMFEARLAQLQFKHEENS